MWLSSTSLIATEKICQHFRWKMDSMLSQVSLYSIYFGGLFSRDGDMLQTIIHWLNLHVFLYHMTLLSVEKPKRSHVGTQIPPSPKHLHSSSHICTVWACFLLSHANLWHAAGPLPGNHMWTTFDRKHIHESIISFMKVYGAYRRRKRHTGWMHPELPELMSTVSGLWLFWWRHVASTTVEDRRRFTHLSGAEVQGSQLQLINIPGPCIGSTFGCQFDPRTA